MVGTLRTQLDTECTAFAFNNQNALCVNVSLADIARRQFVPTNCACSLAKLSGRLNRNHSVLIGQCSGIKQQQIIYDD